MSFLNGLLGRVKNTVNNDLVKPIQRDVVRPATTAARNTGGAIAATNRFLNTAGTGVERSLIGTAQGASGLYDLASRGTGTNRFSKALNTKALAVDAHAKTLPFSAAYKGGQLAGDLASFAVGGGAAKAVAKVPTIAKATTKVADIASHIPSPVAKATTKLVQGNIGQRVVGKTIQTATNPTLTAANAAFTAMQAGKEASQGKQVTPLNTAANFAIGQVGFPLAGHAAGEVAAPMINKGVKELRSAHLIKPTSLSDAELAASQKVIKEQTGWGNQGITAEDAGHFHNAQMKLGHQPGTPEAATAVQDALLQHQAYESVVQQRKQAAAAMKQQLIDSPRMVKENQGGYAKLPFGKNDPAPDLHPEQKNFINDYAEMLQQMDGNGVSLMPNGTRATANSPFYGKVFAETGKAPTKAEWFNEARKQIESGKAGFGASEDYAQLPTQSVQLEAPADFFSKPTAAETPATPTPTQQRAVAPTTKLVAQPSVQDGSLADNTPIDINHYIQQQAKAQEIARKAGQPTGLGKVAAGIKNQKSKMIDSFAPIEDTLNQKITNENATQHITPQIDRALRADTIAGQYMSDNGLANVIQSVPNTKEFDQYLIAKHAADLEANGVKTGRNLAADKQLVEALGNKYEPHAQALQQYSHGLLDKSVDYGLVSKETADMLKAKYPNYVPANRIFGEGELAAAPKGTGGGKASLGSQSVVQRIKGSDRAIESPLASIIKKTQDVVDQGERNKAAQILTGYKDLPGNPFGLRELAPNETVGAKHVISFLDNGQTRRFETTPEVAAAAKSLDKQQLGLIGQILAVPTRVLRLGATGLNVGFAGANAVKDLASGAINSKNPLRSSVANPSVFMKALLAAVNHGSGSYQELVREGAGGTSFDIARNAPKENVAHIRAGRNVGTKALYTVTHPSQLLRAVENTIGRSEEFSRALQYYGGKQAAEKSGATPEAARIMGAHAARNNTVNFARAGDYGRVLNSVLPYLNAGIQGSRTLVRNVGERPAQTVGKIVALGLMPTATITAWNVGTPDRKAAYDDIKDYEKQGNWIIVPPNPVKDASGKWNVIKIPVSQEIANLNNMVRNGVETAVKDGKLHVNQLIGDAVGTVTSLNAQNGRQLIGQVMPQAVKPVLESVVNQNLFTGNKIVPDSQKNLEPRYQVGQGTSGTARVVGDKLNISPRQIDNFVRTAGAGVGQNLVHFADQALAKTGVIKQSDVKGKSVGDSISGRFSGAQGKSQYDIADEKAKPLIAELKNTPGFKAMSPEDKAKALNRLTNQVTSTYTSKKALTPKQQAINENKVNVSDYLTASTGGKDTKALYKSPDAEYKSIQDSYNKKAKAGWNSQAEKIKADKQLASAKVGSSFDKAIRDAHALSNADLYDLVHNDKNGNDIVKKVLAYDDALTNAGVQSKNKFRNKYGNVTIGSASVAKSSGSGKGGSKATGSKAATQFAAALAKKNSSAKSSQDTLLNLIKNAHVTSPKGTPTKATVAGVTLKKQSVKQNKVKAIA